MVESLLIHICCTLSLIVQLKMKLKVVNITCCFWLGSNVDLHWLLANIKHSSRMNAKIPRKRNSTIESRFRGVKVRRGKCTFLIFQSGKCICTGVTSRSMAYVYTNRFILSINRSICEPVSLHDFKVCNLVGAIDLEHKFDTLGFATLMRGSVSLERELFPGLFYRDVAWKGAVVTAFESGKCFATGIKNTKQLRQIALQFAIEASLFSKVINQPTSHGEGSLR